MSISRLNRTASSFALAAVLGLGAATASVGITTEAYAATVNRIQVSGNQRVDADTIRSFITIQPGQNFGSGDIDESVRQLFGTGLFADVRIRQSGNALVVEVIEASVVSNVTFTGNDKLTDAQLGVVAQTDRGEAYDPATVDGDVAAIRDAYSSIGRAVTVTPNVSQQGDGAIAVDFQINEGDRTGVSSIEFVGNDAFSDRRLRGVVSLKRSNPLSFLSRRDVYDPDRIGADEERLRRFYFNRGYADFQIVSTNAVLDPTTNEYAVTFEVSEGQRYTFGDITIDSTVRGLETETLRRRLRTRSGATYSADEVEETLIALSEEVANRGFAFAEVTPRGDRNFANQTIDVDYVIDEGARVFIERIEIRGNTRTRDFVIRREFDVSEGDAFNRTLIQKARRRLERLGYFEKVDIRTVPGSDPDRIVVVVQVEDKSTGEFGIGAGYETAGTGAASGRPSFDLSITERNLLGRGQFVKGSVSGSTQNRTYAFSFTEPFFLGRRIAAGFDIAKEEETFENYDSNTLTGGVRLTAPLTDSLSLTGFYSYSRQDYDIEFGDDPDTPGEQTDFCLASTLICEDNARFGGYTKSSVGYQLTYNTLDNRRDPTKGFYADFRQEFAGVGGDANWLKSTASARYYRPLSEEFGIIGGVKVRGGNVTALDDELRSFDHFFVGPALLRGFESRTIGPRARDADGTISETSIGGTNFVAGTAEVVFPMPLLPEELGLRGAVFADAASTWDYNGPTTVGGNTFTVVEDDFDLRASVGVSVLWSSPFGPLRLDYAEPVSKRDGDQEKNFNFGISSSF